MSRALIAHVLPSASVVMQLFRQALLTFYLFFSLCPMEFLSCPKLLDCVGTLQYWIPLQESPLSGLKLHFQSPLSIFPSYLITPFRKFSLNGFAIFEIFFITI